MDFYLTLFFFFAHAFLFFFIFIFYHNFSNKETRLIVIELFNRCSQTGRNTRTVGTCPADEISFVHSVNSTDGGRKRGENRIASMNICSFVRFRSLFSLTNQWTTPSLCSNFAVSLTAERTKKEKIRTTNEGKKRFIVRSLYHVHHLRQHVFVSDFWFKVKKNIFARVEMISLK